MVLLIVPNLLLVDLVATLPVRLLRPLLLLLDLSLSLSFLTLSRGVVGLLSPSVLRLTSLLNALLLLDLDLLFTLPLDLLLRSLSLVATLLILLSHLLAVILVLTLGLLLILLLVFLVASLCAALPLTPRISERPNAVEIAKPLKYWFRQ